MRVIRSIGSDGIRCISTFKIIKEVINDRMDQVNRLQIGLGDDRDFSSQDIARALGGDQALKDQIEKSIAKGNTLEGCRSRAFIKSAKEIRIADDLIQRQMLNIRHLQKGLDSIDLKKRILKRMDLEIKGIEDKLLAIEHDPKKD